MLHSTTSTGSYTLTKYSRSHPSSVVQQAQNTTADFEWQHFVNPVIKLVLDIKKSTSGVLESVRLRIIWNMNYGPDDMDIDQRDVVFVSPPYHLIYAHNTSTSFICNYRKTWIF